MNLKYLCTIDRTDLLIVGSLNGEPSRLICPTCQKIWTLDEYASEVSKRLSDIYDVIGVGK